MSAPDTNVEKQVRRHRGPLFGIAIAIALAAVVFVAFLGWTAYQGETPAQEAAVGQPTAAQSSTPVTETIGE